MLQIHCWLNLGEWDRYNKKICNLIRTLGTTGNFTKIKNNVKIFKAVCTVTI